MKVFYLCLLSFLLVGCATSPPPVVTEAPSLFEVSQTWEPPIGKVSMGWTTGQNTCTHQEVNQEKGASPTCRIKFENGSPSLVVFGVTEIGCKELCVRGLMLPPSPPPSRPSSAQREAVVIIR